MSPANPNSRLEAFSDGVFAIALTLLIIEIKIPSFESVHAKSELWIAFAKAWPSWFAFLVSFITILISWVNHSHALELIDKTSAKFTYANGLLLLAIIILPFPTAAVAEYIQTDYSQPAVTLYCAVALLNNIAWLVIWHSFFYPQSLYKSGITLQQIKNNSSYTKIGFGLYSFVFVLSFWFPITAFTLIGLSYIAWLILGISIKEEKRGN